MNRCVFWAQLELIVNIRSLLSTIHDFSTFVISWILPVNLWYMYFNPFVSSGITLFSSRFPTANLFTLFVCKWLYVHILFHLILNVISVCLYQLQSFWLSLCQSINDIVFITALSILHFVRSVNPVATFEVQLQINMHTQFVSCRYLKRFLFLLFCILVIFNPIKQSSNS